MDLIEKAAARLAEQEAKNKQDDKTSAELRTAESKQESLVEKAAARQSASLDDKTPANKQKSDDAKDKTQPSAKPPAEPQPAKSATGRVKPESQPTSSATGTKTAETAGEVAEASPMVATPQRVVLDHASLESHGLVVPDSNRSKIKEEFRHIKRPLLTNVANSRNTNRHSNLIMVTSSHPGEGKTFTALNLALSIAAERDKTVLLVDADVIRPTIGEFLNIKATGGLVEYLEGGNDISDLMVRTDLSTLRVLPAGNPHHLSTELLASEAMSQLMDELATRYPDRIIIFDSPPLLATSEACVLGSLMGQIVIVVEAERTTQADVHEALERIKPAPDVAVGFVLNKTRRESDSGYYGYSYY